ncbi:MAG: 50S ribosomal protein L17 [Planctomycetota bacterium]
MRHLVRGRALGRTSAHKKALKKNLLSSLFLHERIVTTVAKAKEFRPAAERVITLAKEKSLHNIRLATIDFPGRSGREVVMKLFNEIGPRFAARNGGYTRILKLGQKRLGDNAPTAIFELVMKGQKPEATETEVTKATKTDATKAGKASEAGAAKKEKKTTKKAAVKS